MSFCAFKLIGGALWPTYLIFAHVMGSSNIGGFELAILIVTCFSFCYHCVLIVYVLFRRGFRFPVFGAQTVTSW